MITWGDITQEEMVKKGNLKREIELLLIAAQNYAIRITLFKENIDNTHQNNKCR